LEHGADVNAADGAGRTPLHDAVVIRDAAMVTFLLEHGADYTKRDDDGYMPIDLAPPGPVRDALAAARAQTQETAMAALRSRRGPGGTRAPHVPDEMAREIASYLGGGERRKRPSRKYAKT
jgi:hypothetical protein